MKWFVIVTAYLTIASFGSDVEAALADERIGAYLHQEIEVAAFAREILAERGELAAKLDQVIYVAKASTLSAEMKASRLLVLSLELQRLLEHRQTRSTLVTLGGAVLGGFLYSHLDSTMVSVGVYEPLFNLVESAVALATGGAMGAGSGLMIEQALRSYYGDRALNHEAISSFQSGCQQLLTQSNP